MTDTSTLPATEPAATPEEQAQALYETLKPLAIAYAREFVMRQTPAALQDAMTDIIAADFPPPEPDPAKLPDYPGENAIKQLAAMRAVSAAAESKIAEVEAMFKPKPEAVAA